MEAARLRWRLRGAWMWPAYFGLTLADALVLELLPIWGDGPGGVVPALLLAGSLNLIVVAILAPLAARPLRRRRPDLPRPIANDYAGTALLVAFAGVLLVDGLAHRPGKLAERDDRRAQAAAVVAYVRSQAPEYEHGLSGADTVRLGDDIYRTCVPGPDPDRPLCVIVDTDQDPAGVSRDPAAVPNSAYRN